MQIIESSVIIELVKVADTPNPKGKRVGCSCSRVSSEEAKPPPEYRWNLNRSQIILGKRGKPHGLSHVQRVIGAQAMTNAQEVADSGGSECSAVTAEIGLMPTWKRG